MFVVCCIRFVGCRCLRSVCAMESAEGVGPEASKKGIGASANSSAPEYLGEPAFDEARSDSGSQSTGVTKRSDEMQKQMEEGRTGTGNEGATYRWPPKREDLEKFYLAQRLSAMKISRLYGLKYPNPKSGESMVLWYLKKFGIKRRDPAEHIRNVSKDGRTIPTTVWSLRLCSCLCQAREVDWIRMEPRSRSRWHLRVPLAWKIRSSTRIRG